MMFHGIIFDLDGTLLDTLPDLASALNKTLTEFHFPGHTLEFYKKAIGSGARDHVKSSLPPEKQHDDSFIDLVFARYRVIYDECWRKQTKLFPGIAELLNHLVHDEKIALAILTNKPQEFTDRMAEAYFSKWPFDFIYGALDNIPRKPHPIQAQKILKSWGQEASPKKVMMVGDSDIDIFTGKNAGLFSVGVTWGFREQAELEEAKADATIDKPGDLLTILHSLS